MSGGAMGSNGTPRRVLILYGTETGNAQDYAEMTAKKIQRLRAQVIVKCMDQCQLSDLTEESYLLFLVSTTGQGELPRNALSLWKQLLRKKLPPSLLSNVKFQTFGLGDSSYPRYNWAIRKIHKRVSQLGAQELAVRGEGDEQNSEGPDAHFEKWVTTVCDELEGLFEEKMDRIPENELLPPRFTIEVDEQSEDILSEKNLKQTALTRPGVQTAKITSNERITTKDHFQDVRHLKLDSVSEKDTLKYQCGDTIALYPSNHVDEIDLLIKHQGWENIANKLIKVNDEFISCLPGGLVQPLTLRNLLLHHLDIVAVPRRSFFATVWHFASDEDEQERLWEFSILDGIEDLFDYANRPRRSVLETILEFTSLKIPISYLVEVMPILRPRLFSIASQPQLAPSVELAVAIVKYKTIIRRIRRGLCTRWITTLENDDMIPYTLHKSPLPCDETRPAIMIAPGTGIAPMRSLILSEKINSPMYLFFGCRHKSKDYIFAEDWKDVENLTVHAAFSRDTDGDSGGGYVQTQLMRQRKTVGELIVDQDATVYLCGSSGAMPRQVRLTLVEIVRQFSNSSEEDANSYVQDMEVKGRYLQETWN